MIFRFSWPSWPQWRQLPKVLPVRERYVTAALIVVAIVAGLGWAYLAYLDRTTAIPAYGGTYTEALVGDPQFINPLLAGANDTDRDIAALVYSGLMKYDVAGNVVPDLAEGYEFSGDGKIYTLHLRRDVTWHDGKPFGADDVVFTIGAITNPEYNSPLRQGWLGITAQEIDGYTVVITLPQPFAQFPERLTLGILPKHIWSGIGPKKALLADANLKPIGTGPFMFKKFTKDKFGVIISYTLVANESFYDGRPYLDEVVFSLYADESEAAAAYASGSVMGASYLSPKSGSEVASYGTTVHRLHIPKYFAIFFNQSQNKALADKNVRSALAAATNKQEIIDRVFDGNATVVDTALLPWMPGYDPEVPRPTFSPEEARTLLEKAGWRDSDGDGVREKTIGTDKEPTALDIRLATSDFPGYIQTSEILKAQWESIGARVILQNENIEDLKQNLIRPRKYDALLFGETLSHQPDPYPFWHSSQKKDPGWNLALYDDKETDQLLEKLRSTISREEQHDILKKIQNNIAQDGLVLFLYSPDYLYVVNRKIQGIAVENIATPARRFTDVNTWHRYTTRIAKTE